jgi:hypothetical protein
VETKATKTKLAPETATNHSSIGNNIKPFTPFMLHPDVMSISLMPLLQQYVGPGANGDGDGWNN